MRRIKVKPGQPPLRHFFKEKPTRMGTIKNKIASIGNTIISFFKQYILSKKQTNTKSEEAEAGNGNKGSLSQQKQEKILDKLTDKQAFRIYKFNYEMESSEQDMPPNVNTDKTSKKDMNMETASSKASKQPIKRVKKIIISRNKQPTSQTQNIPSRKPIDPKFLTKSQSQLKYSDSQNKSQSEDIAFQFQDQGEPKHKIKRISSISHQQKLKSKIEENPLAQYEVSSPISEEESEGSDDDDGEGQVDGKPRKRVKSSNQQYLDFLSKFNQQKMKLIQEAQDRKEKKRIEQQKKKEKQQKEAEKQEQEESLNEKNEDIKLDPAKRVRRLIRKYQQVKNRKPASNKQKAQKFRPAEIQIKPKILHLSMQKMLQIVREPLPKPANPFLSTDAPTPKPVSGIYNFSPPNQSQTNKKQAASSSIQAPIFQPFTTPLTTQIPSLTLTLTQNTDKNIQALGSKKQNSDNKDNKQGGNKGLSFGGGSMFGTGGLGGFGAGFGTGFGGLGASKNDGSEKTTISGLGGLGANMGSGLVFGGSGLFNNNQKDKQAKNETSNIGQTNQTQSPTKQQQNQAKDKSNVQPTQPLFVNQVKKQQPQPLLFPSLTPKQAQKPIASISQPAVSQPQQTLQNIPSAQKDKGEDAKKQESPPKAFVNPFLQPMRTKLISLDSVIKNYSPSPSLMPNNPNSQIIFDLFNKSQQSKYQQNKFSTPTKNILQSHPNPLPNPIPNPISILNPNPIPTLKSQSKKPSAIEPQDDQSSMFDQSEASGSKRQDNPDLSFRHSHVPNISAGSSGHNYFSNFNNNNKQSSYASSFGSSLLNASQAQQIPNNYLTSMPEVDLKRSLEMFGKSHHHNNQSLGLFSQIQETKKKPESRNKKKNNQKRIY